MTLADLELELAKRGVVLAVHRSAGRWLALVTGEVSGTGESLELDVAVYRALAKFDEKIAQSFCKGSA
jgi:hypothetical protein